MAPPWLPNRKPDRGIRRSWLPRNDGSNRLRPQGRRRLPETPPRAIRPTTRATLSHRPRQPNRNLHHLRPLRNRQSRPRRPQGLSNPRLALEHRPRLQTHDPAVGTSTHLRSPSLPPALESHRCRDGRLLQSRGVGADLARSRGRRRYPLEGDPGDRRRAGQLRLPALTRIADGVARADV